MLADDTDGRGAPALERLDDAALVGRILARDSDALSELSRRHAGTLLALARRILGDATDAEEVVQEALLQVWNQAGRYDSDRSSVATWLVLITRSRAIDRLRTRQVGERTLVALRDEGLAVHTSPTGPRDVLLRERRRRLAAALAELPEEQRRVVALAFYGGRTQREIAEETGIPLGTVKTRTLLAMKKLRMSLRDVVQELL